ncbi:MAG: TolC family protein [Proteobacteria bacterium]|nr:TolC family protein [Pseudomonadota bacterium]
MKQCSLALVFLFCATCSQAMDLVGMQAMALNNREVVQQYMTVLLQSEKEIVRAKGGYYPSVDLSYTSNVLDEDSLFEKKENSVALGKISWNLFAGFRDKYGLHSAEMLREVERYKLQGVRQDLQLNVALAYLAVFERRANRSVAESAFQALGKIYKDGESRFQVGLIGKNELLKFRVDYDNADITFKSADAGLQKSVNDLSRQVGSEISLADLDFADFDNLPPLADREQYIEKMLVERSEIKAMEAVIAATSAQAQAAKGGYYPRVDAVGSYRRYDDNFIVGNGSIDDEELRAQLVMSMNLYQGNNTEATVAKALLQARSQQYELQELKHGLVNELGNLFVDLQVNLDNVLVAKRSIEQAEENLRITQLKYDEGLQRESDLLDAITSLSRAQYNHVAVIRTVFTNHFRLTRMIGGF